MYSPGTCYGGGCITRPPAWPRPQPSPLANRSWSRRCLSAILASRSAPTWPVSPPSPVSPAPSASSSPASSSGPAAAPGLAEPLRLPGVLAPGDLLLLGLLVRRKACVCVRVCVCAYVCICACVHVHCTAWRVWGFRQLGCASEVVGVAEGGGIVGCGVGETGPFGSEAGDSLVPQALVGGRVNLPSHIRLGTRLSRRQLLLKFLYKST